MIRFHALVFCWWSTVETDLLHECRQQRQRFDWGLAPPPSTAAAAAVMLLRRRHHMSVYDYAWWMHREGGCMGGLHVPGACHVTGHTHTKSSHLHSFRVRHLMSRCWPPTASDCVSEWGSGLYGEVGGLESCIWLAIMDGPPALKLVSSQWCVYIDRPAHTKPAAEALGTHDDRHCGSSRLGWACWAERVRGVQLRMFSGWSRASAFSHVLP